MWVLRRSDGDAAGFRLKYTQLTLNWPAPITGPAYGRVFIWSTRMYSPRTMFFSHFTTTAMAFLSVSRSVYRPPCKRTNFSGKKKRGNYPAPRRLSGDPRSAGSFSVVFIACAVFLYSRSQRARMRHPRVSGVPASRPSIGKLIVRSTRVIHAARLFLIVYFHRCYLSVPLVIARYNYPSPENCSR
jgi:hypothetical protein